MSSKDGDTDVPMDNNKVSNDEVVVVDPIMNEGVSFFFFSFLDISRFETSTIFSQNRAVVILLL